MNVGVNELRAILAAYKQVMEASWPSLHPAMDQRSKKWPTASESELKQELAAYVAEASGPRCRVRLFWKFTPGFVFGGCNALFARDAGVASPADVVNTDDSHKQFPWRNQAAKYRADDQNVVNRGVPMLDIVERQQSPSGAITWVRVGKTPIRVAGGKSIGVFGMYEVLDPEVGQKLFVDRLKQA
jgi:hypothetical protein